MARSLVRIAPLVTAVTGLLAPFGCAIEREDPVEGQEQALTFPTQPPIPGIPTIPPGTPLPVIQWPPNIQEARAVNNGTFARTTGYTCYPAITPGGENAPYVSLFVGGTNVLSSSGVASARACEGSRCFSGIASGTSGSQDWAFAINDPLVPTWSWASPPPRRIYRIEVTGRNGKVATRDVEVRFGPRIRAGFEGAIVESGPASGAGTRTFTGLLTLVNADGYDVAPLGLVYAHRTGFGAGSFTRSVSFSAAFTAAEYSAYVSGGRSIFLEAGSTTTVDGCTPTKINPPAKPAPRVTSTPTDPPGTTEPPTTIPTCRDECIGDTPAAGWVVDLRWNPTCGGSESTLPNARTVCPVDGWPSGTHREVCSSLGVPSGWHLASTHHADDHCIPTTIGEANVDDLVKD